MESNDINSSSPNPTTAVSIFGQGANTGDFPVLKAFQEYIDAEQAKARKRMIGLSAFFVVLMTLVVITFVVILVAVMNRNQSLSDRLLDYALKERTPIVQQPAVQSQPTVQQAESSKTDVVLKAVIDQISRLTETLNKPKVILPEVPAKSVDVPVLPVESETHKAIERLRKEREKLELEAERKKLKEVKEKAHQEEVEQHRRRLYPEYYVQKDAEKKGTKNTSPSKIPEVKPVPIIPSVSPSPVENTTTAVDVSSTNALSSIKPINYFDNTDDDEELKLLARNAADKRNKSKRSQPVVKPKDNKAVTTKESTLKTISPLDKEETVHHKTNTPLPNTQTINITTESNSIPWIVELPAVEK